MAVNNDSNLINQICTASGLQGKDLDALKTRLSKMSESELHIELTKAITGKNLTKDMGLVVERTGAAPVFKPAQAAHAKILKEQQCKEVTCQIIDENLREAFDIFNSQHLGDISGAYDNAKGEDDKLKTSNVAKVLGYQQEGLTQIIEAKDQNLTKRQFYEENKQRIKDMILTRLNVLKTSTGTSYIDAFRGKYSKEEMTEIINTYVESLCSDASIEKLKDIQLQFVSYNQTEEAEALSNFVKGAKKFQENWHDTTTNMYGNEGATPKIKSPDKGIIPSYWDSDEPISFEEVYKLERGTEYSQYEVEKYVQAKTEMETVISAFNKKQQFVDFTNALIKEDLPLADKEEKLLAGFAEFYALSEDSGLSQLQKIIDRSKLPVTIENGKLNLSGYSDDASKIRVLNQILKLAGQEKEKEFKVFLGGKTLEEYQLSFEKTANNILGEENSKLLAGAMVNDNMGMIKRYTGNTSMAGMALTVVGGVLCFTPAAPLGAAMVTVGNTAAIGGMVAKTGLGAVDYATKDIKTQEELEDLAKDFVMDAGGFIIGMKAGQTGIKAFSKLIDKKLAATFGEHIARGNKAQALKTIISNPEYLKSFSQAAGAKISTDFLISYIGDLAMIGVLDTHDDWKSLLQANLTGILVGMSGDIKDVAGVRKVKAIPEKSTDIASQKELTMNMDALHQKANTENPDKVLLEENTSDNDASTVDRQKSEQQLQNGAKVTADETAVMTNIEKNSKIEEFGQIHKKSDPERIVDKKSQQKISDVLNILNTKEGIKDIKEDIKNKIAILIGNSDDLNQGEIITLIDRLKNAKQRWGKDTEEYNDEQLLEIISHASNSDGSLNINALRRLCKRMDGGPQKDNFKMDKVLPNIVKELKYARNSDGFYDAKLMEISQKLVYAHNTREEIFKLIKDEDGNPVNDLIELVLADKSDDFDDGGSILNVLKSLYTDGKLDSNKVSQMSQMVKDGVSIYRAAIVMKSDMPADILKNIGVFNQKGLTNDEINNVIGYLKNNNIEPTFEAVKNMVENCGKIPELREIHLKQLLHQRGESIDNSYYNYVKHLAQKIEQFTQEHPEKADEYPEDIVANYIKLLHIEGRSVQLKQNEILELLYDRSNGTCPFDIDKLVDSGLLGDIPGRSKPLQLRDLMRYQKEETNVLKNAISKGLLSEDYSNVLNLNEKSGSIVTAGGRSTLERLTELSDKELKNLKEMDVSDFDFDFRTAISLAKCDPAKVRYVLDAIKTHEVEEQCNLLQDFNIDLAYKMYKCMEQKIEGLDSRIAERILSRTTSENISQAHSFFDNRKELGITADKIPSLLLNSITEKQVKKAVKVMGRKNFSVLENVDVPIAIKFIDLYGKSDINELSAAAKRKFREQLVESNANLFGMSEKLREYFPVLPKSQEEYCETMVGIVKSLGIETKPLTESQIKAFENGTKDLGKQLSTISDTDFASLSITLEYPRESFIRTVLEKTKDLPENEKQKVYDYFGFELHHNETNETGYTLTGYPANINNGVKLEKIKSETIKHVIESLRSDVIRFSENNKIKCNNPKIEQLLNQVLEALPEIRTMVGKTQHGTHDFDVMQHSLKVMQKIAQDPKFETLSESDKKVMLITSIMHDITKTEGKTDSTHATQSSFDTSFIARKFNLTKEESIKMYTLIRSHEWLSFVNGITSKSINKNQIEKALREYNKNLHYSKRVTELPPEEMEKLYERELTRRLQSVAFDLQQDNMFELALMFTHADLKAVKADDTFHDTTDGASRASFDGKTRVFTKQGRKVSHGQAAEIYADRIREYVHELKKTRPLTPVTKVPDAETIRSRITRINPDGSTNFKGVFVDNDGLIVIKFNSVEDWEALGFPKGTTTKGIKGTGKLRYNDNSVVESEFETGNFKFFAHALDYANQLIKFDSFTLPDSNVLLSATYMERPESKYRNYRTQGVGLNVASKYVYGGGETDAGSGCGKNVDEFKKNYIFGGRREGDRVFTANIVKRITGMTDEEYIQFYEKNQNKTWEEAEPIDGSDPVEFRNKLIKAYAENIVSTVRGGSRAYDEYYISNPEEPMFSWLYAVDPKEIIGENPLEYLHRTELTPGEKETAHIGLIKVEPVAKRIEFLRQYSLKRGKVMFVFGD